MKRSKNAKLTLMVAGSALALSACEEKPQHQVETYETLDACLDADLFSDSQCRTDHEKALAVHAQSAPRFESQSLCGQEFTRVNCESHTSASGSTFWSPLMAGFLVSRILDRDRHYYYSSPYYRNGRGHYYTWDGYRMGEARGQDGRYRKTIGQKTVEAKPKKARVMTRTSVISRGGFGRRSSSRSSGGRSRGG